MCERLLLLLLVLAGSAAAENKTFSSVSEALRYIKNNQPAELTIENVKFKPTDLLKIRDAMPEGSVFRFSSTWGKVLGHHDPRTSRRRAAAFHGSPP